MPVPDETDVDLNKWLKEIQGAESLMSDVEAKADSLQVKVDALLAEMTSIEQERKANPPQIPSSESPSN
ncbi:hypothetical protein J3Q64DRAFT_1746162 [Phycomyces blakesleeanus]|uniref:PH domain-containing protein n=1 Tax=Phycomyces blakesleeanus TaxID=4837 RepID=A0ABR3AYH2_PHYBL